MSTVTVLKGFQVSHSQMTMRKTKIVATMGPACSSPEVLRAMLQSGMNVARLNFSHGTHEQHRQTLRMLREISAELKNPLGILQDLCGPKLRVGEISTGTVLLKTGSEAYLSVNDGSTSAGRLPIPSIPWLPRAVQEGQRVLIDDGSIQLRVKEIRAEEVVCTVVVGGLVSSHKGINLPDTLLADLKIPTEKDEQDLVFGINEEVDYVAVSFVRTAEDVRNVRRLLQLAHSRVRVIAKIEKLEALNNILGIVQESDGVMVARGDLGVETDLETVVLKQKEIIALCNRYGKIVITATQMLQSMIQSPTPTRAEVADVTNAILDGTDAVMLSGETAVGQHPVEAVHVMANIATKTENAFDSERYLSWKELSEDSMSAAVAHASCLLAKELSAAAIIANTESGHTAEMVSRYRPRPAILAMSRHATTVRQLTIVWGVYPFLIDEVSSTDELLEKAIEMSRRSGLVRQGERVVITAGVPVGQVGATNLIKTAVL